MKTCDRCHRSVPITWSCLLKAALCADCFDVWEDRITSMTTDQHQERLRKKMT